MGGINEWWSRLKLGRSTPPAPLLSAQVLDRAPFGYIQVDAENRIIYSNSCACQLLGVPAPRVDTQLLKWVRSYELDQLIAHTRQQSCLPTPTYPPTYPATKDWQWQTVIPDPENPLPQPSRWLRGYGVPLAQNQVGIYLQDRQEVNDLAQQCDRWTADVAHELKTPLTAMRLLTETLQTRVDERSKIWVDRLLAEVLRLSDLVQDVLSLNQVRQPQTLELSDIHLASLVNSVWQTLAPIAHQRKVQLECLIPDHLLLNGDASRLYRLLLNLLDNGIRHSPTLQRVLISAEITPEQMVMIDVIDCGDGFTPEAIRHGFERFYRGDASRCRYGEQEGGSGLGLAIAHQIVQLHRGKMQLMNSPETGGAQVKVYLPLHQKNIP